MTTSPRSSGRWTRDDWAQPLTLIGHSLGGILAVEFAARYPERVRGLVVMSMPLFADEAEARAFITTHGGWVARSTLRTGRRADLEYLFCMPLRPAGKDAGAGGAAAECSSSDARWWSSSLPEQHAAGLTATSDYLSDRP